MCQTKLQTLAVNKVLLVDTSSQTVIGKPIVPDATVHAVIEDHALDANILVFKKNRRKRYQRIRGHPQVDTVAAL
uniref:50S ribosomal protein L21, mitochondrial-like isoform X3 n=1 Tax=Fragaria vesca subsp. vesca TaxID=101020 RepID=UPI0005CB41C0|nr:PREDICTED: 50S ribosomal protein L21, mitochondrial-like isoform X3 [Fragaria vesca subsp. vesca]